MTFLEMLSSLDEDSRNFDIMSQKINIFIESSYRDYLISREEAELKVLTESQSDLVELYTEAEEKFKDRMKKTLIKIKENLKKFIDALISKIRSLFTSKKTKDAVDEIEKTVNRNPNLRNKEVEYDDTTKEEKCILDAIHETDKKIAEMKSRPCTPKDLEELREINTECAKKRKIIAASAATVVGLSTAIILFKKHSKNIEKDLKKSAEDDMVCDVDDEESGRIIIEAYNQKASLTKSLSSVWTAKLRSLWNAIHGKVEVVDPDEIPPNKTQK